MPNDRSAPADTSRTPTAPDAVAPVVPVVPGAPAPDAVTPAPDAFAPAPVHPPGVAAVPEAVAPAAPEAPAPAAPRGYRAVFAVAEFRAVFAAHLFSLLGVVVSELALTVLVYDLTGSPLLSALTFALGLLPYLIGGTLFAGVADRYPARRVLVVCDLLCAACVAVMLVPATPVAGLLALRCLVAAIAPVFTGTRMAALTDILGEGDLYVLGRSLLRIVSQSAMLIGFGAGGVLLTVLAPRGAIAVTAVTFLASAALLRFGTRARPARSGDGGGTLLKESLAGARLILGDRRVRALMLLFWVPPMFVVAPEALAAPYADAIGVPSAALGLLLCSMAVGHIGAELFVGSALSPRNRSRIVLPVAAVGLLPLVAYAVRPGLPLAVAALALAGAGAAYVIGLDQWFVDAVPEELRGRAMTLLTAGLMTVQGLGMALAGLAAEFFPVHQVVAGSGILGTVCTLLLVAEVRATAPGRMSDTEGRDRADRHVTCG
ncbi:MFS transporter [Streptomyces californicus]|uniref:MFS transporter n=1 Tax=Streptomyces californicus TaxID=67351 RepID=UPI00296F8053|nr:MFS transporter [Streptomyces californicus]MDW4899107.1 MFS transporter [Streptomyces californicus]